MAIFKQLTVVVTLCLSGVLAQSGPALAPAPTVEAQLASYPNSAFVYHPSTPVQGTAVVRDRSALHCFSYAAACLQERGRIGTTTSSAIQWTRSVKRAVASVWWSGA